MSDIVERLRVLALIGEYGNTVEEAADELERLRAENADLRQKLEAGWIAVTETAVTHLKAENAALRTDLKEVMNKWSIDYAQLEAKRAQVESLRLDAERLRQMRSLFSGNWEAVEVILDAAIDSAREEGK